MARRSRGRDRGDRAPQSQPCAITNQGPDGLPRRGGHRLPDPHQRLTQRQATFLDVAADAVLIAGQTLEFEGRRLIRAFARRTVLFCRFPPPTGIGEGAAALGPQRR